jgi:hypothetical protein
MLDSAFAASILLHGSSGTVRHTCWCLAMIARSGIVIPRRVRVCPIFIGMNFSVQLAYLKIIPILTGNLTGATTNAFRNVKVKTHAHCAPAFVERFCILLAIVLYSLFLTWND